MVVEYRGGVCFLLCDDRAAFDSTCGDISLVSLVEIIMCGWVDGRVGGLYIYVGGLVGVVMVGTMMAWKASMGWMEERSSRRR